MNIKEPLIKLFMETCIVDVYRLYMIVKGKKYYPNSPLNLCNEYNLHYEPMQIGDRLKVFYPLIYANKRANAIDIIERYYGASRKCKTLANFYPKQRKVVILGKPYRAEDLEEALLLTQKFTL